MELILVGIIVLQFIYIIFKDVKVGQERENMLLKLMSKDIKEYKDSVETIVDKPTKQVPENMIPIEDVPVEKILKANQ
jgi:hypothetical protein